MRIAADLQENLGIPAPPALNTLPGMASALIRPRADSTPSARIATPTSMFVAPAGNSEATQAHAEQLRLLIMGMEQRLQTREEKLLKTIEKADVESARFEEMRKQALSTPS